MEANSYISDGMLDEVNLEKKNLARVEHRRNIALLTDFVSNLATIISSNRGGRYNVITNNTATENARLDEARRRLSDAQRDYNGRMAMMAFKNIYNASSDKSVNRATNPSVATSKLHKPIIINPGLVKPKPLQLLSSINISGRHRTVPKRKR